MCVRLLRVHGVAGVHRRLCLADCFSAGQHGCLFGGGLCAGAVGRLSAHRTGISRASESPNDFKSMNELTVTTRLDASVFAPPIHDKRFLNLGDDLQDLVLRRLSAMQKIAGAKKVKAGLREVVAELAACNDNEIVRGCGLGTLRNLWYKFSKAGGDWTKLLDKAQAGAKWWNSLDEQGLPQGFIDYLGEQWAANQRDKFRSEWSKLKVRWDLWRRGDNGSKIPGYDRCPDPRSDTCLPDGWSYRNLKRVAEKSARDYSRKVIQIGPKAAALLSLHIPMTREGVEVGQYYLFDDSWNDFEVLFRGRATRLLSLHALDLASGCNVLRGYKPAWAESPGDVEERLKEREMVWLGVKLLATEGLHPAGTTFICEKRTATFPQWIVEKFTQLFGGKLIVNDGPAGGGPGVAGLFTGRGGGNPRWKAPLESWFNLLRNHTANVLEFPGQTGATSIALGSQPEGLSKMAAMDEAMHKCLAILPKEKADAMRFNLLQHDEAMLSLDAVTEVINTRRDHHLQGWRESKNIIAGFRLAEHLPFEPVTTLEDFSDAEREHYGMLIKSNPNLRGEIVLSPREVYSKGREKLQRITPAQAALLMAMVDSDQAESVKGGLLEVNVPEVNPDEPLQYGPFLRDCDGRQETMRNDDKYLVRVNPFMPDTAFLFDAKNGFVGFTKRYSRTHRGDVDALQEKFKTKAKVVSDWTREARKVATPITKRAAEIAANNAAVIDDVRKEQQQLEDLAASALMNNNARRKAATGTSGSRTKTVSK